MEFELKLDKRTRMALEKIAKEQGRDIDEVATEAFEYGLDNFLAFAVPLRLN
jgi:hypothetical protein